MSAQYWVLKQYFGHSNSTLPDAAECDYAKCHCRAKEETRPRHFVLDPTDEVTRLVEFRLCEGLTGGDEFVALLEDLSGASGAVRVAERIMEELRVPFAIGGHRLHTSASIGIALNAASGEVVGVEALLRWQHAERGLLAPTDFMPLAEETGLIVPIGRWVLSETCRQARAWQELRPHGAPLMACVNLSVSARPGERRRSSPRSLRYPRPRSPLDRLLVPVDVREKIVEAHVAGAGDEAVARGHQHLVLHAEFHPGACYGRHRRRDAVAPFALVILAGWRPRERYWSA